MLKTSQLILLCYIFILVGCKDLAKPENDETCSIDTIYKFAYIKDFSFTGYMKVKGKRSQAIQFSLSKDGDVVVAIMKDTSFILAIDKPTLIDDNLYLKIVPKTSPMAKVTVKNLTNPSMFDIQVTNQYCLAESNESEKVLNELSNLETLLSDVESQVVTLSKEMAKG